MQVAVVGLGYVGLPLAVSLSDVHRVQAHDISEPLIQSLQGGRDPAGEVLPEVLQRALSTGALAISEDPAVLRMADVIIVAVPTPIDETKRPDVSALCAAATSVGKNLKPGALIVLESTVYPGCTEDLFLPLVERYSELRCDEDFDLAYSPERVVPGDAAKSLRDVDKLVAGRTPKALERAMALYEDIVDAPLHACSSIRVAEAAKVLENVQRDLNIALMNELAIVMGRAGIDTNEVIDAAATKWNFHSYRPGLVGGHCIGVDPYYLTHMAECLGYHPDVILAGRRVNDAMGRFVARKVIELLIQADTRVRGSVVTVLGLTFKEDVADLRNSRVVELVDELAAHGVDLVLHDAVADAGQVQAMYGRCPVEDWKQRRSDAVVLAVPHQAYLDELPGWLHKRSVPVVVDIKGVLARELTDLASDRLGWRL